MGSFFSIPKEYQDNDCKGCSYQKAARIVQNQPSQNVDLGSSSGPVGPAVKILQQCADRQSIYMLEKAGKDYHQKHGCSTK